MTADDLRHTMGGAFAWNRHLEDEVGGGAQDDRRRRHGDERVEEDGAIVIVGAHRRGIASMWRVRVATPMRVDRPAIMMWRRVLVRMGMDERRSQDTGLEGQHQRRGNRFPHDVPIVRDAAHSVKRDPAVRCSAPHSQPAKESGRNRNDEDHRERPRTGR